MEASFIAAGRFREKPYLERAPKKDKAAAAFRRSRGVLVDVS
jgi:hypothetical protein